MMGQPGSQNVRRILAVVGNWKLKGTAENRPTAAANNRPLGPEPPMLPLVAAAGSVVIVNVNAANAGRTRGPEEATGKR